MSSPPSESGAGIIEVPPNQRAWVYRSHGLPSAVLTMESAWPVPTPTGDRVLVRITHSSINPADWKTMGRGPLLISMLIKKPGIPNGDFSGIVVGGKLEGTGLEIGMEVYGQIPTEVVLFTGRGSLAEYAAVSPPLIIPKPPNISLAEAASVSLAGLTSWLSLVRTAKLQSGQRVFINGGSGGTGVWGIQIAKALGAYVVSTASDESEALLRTIGVDETIKYKKVDLIPHLAANYSTPELQFDVIYDCVGHDPALFYQCQAYLRPSGIYVDIAALAHVHNVLDYARGFGSLANKWFRPRLLGGIKRKYAMVVFRASQQGEGLRQLDKWMRDGKIKPIIDSIYPFEQAVEAFERQMSNRAKGKVVIRVS